MSQVPVAPPPPSGNGGFDRWMYLLWQRITKAGQILWSTIDKSGSNITDISTRRHRDLQDLQGGTTDEYYHLTSSEYTGTGTGVFVRTQSPTISDPTINNIDFTTNTEIASVPGRLTWNPTDGTLNLGMGYDDVVQQIGLEQYYHVKNQTGAQLNNGYAARAVGVVGNSGQLKAGYALADGSILPRFNLGIFTMDIPDGEDGYVTSFGLVRGINTTGSVFGETWQEGDVLYVSPTTPGYLTKVEPTPPHQRIILAIVVNASSNGSLYVRPTIPSDLHALNDVYLPSPQPGSVLVYDFDQERWESRILTLGTGLTKTDNGTHLTIDQVAFVGDSGTGGFIGAVPAPSAGDGAEAKYLAADGLWRTLTVSDHNALSGLEGGINEGVFEPTAFETTAFQQGVVQFYHLTQDQYTQVVAGNSILSTAIDTTLTDDYETVLVTVSAKTITLPKAQPTRYGRQWTIVQNCTGYVDIEPDPSDEVILAGGSDTIRLTQIGTNVTLRCVSATQWVIV